MSCSEQNSILSFSLALLLICFACTEAYPSTTESPLKSSIVPKDCEIHHPDAKSIASRLDKVCEDCYNLFREPQLHTLCRKNCFSNDYFASCVKVLLLDDKVEDFQDRIKKLTAGTIILPD